MDNPGRRNQFIRWTWAQHATGAPIHLPQAIRIGVSASENQKYREASRSPPHQRMGLGAADQAPELSPGVSGSKDERPVSLGVPRRPRWRTGLIAQRQWEAHCIEQCQVKLHLRLRDQQSHCAKPLSRRLHPLGSATGRPRLRGRLAQRERPTARRKAAPSEKPAW